MLFGGHLRKQPRHLKAADQPRLHPRGRRRPGDLGTIKIHAARVGLELPGHQVDERGLARAIGADQRRPVALLHRQRYIIGHRQPAKTAREIADFKQAHERPPRRRFHKVSTAPVSPLGANSTTAISNTPTMVSQWNGLMAETRSSNQTKTRVPSSAPNSLPVPPSTSITNASADMVKDRLSSPTTLVAMADMAPPSPATAPAMAYILTRVK